MLAISCALFVQRFGYTHFQSTKLCQSAQTADTGIAGIGFLLQVVYHLVSVVGSHRDRDTTALLQFKEGFHHVIHVHVSFQVVGFVEIAFGVALCTAQMDKVDAVGKLLHDGCTIVGAAYTERTGAEAKTVALVGNSVNQCLEIGSTAHDAWQAEDGARWVVRMDNEHDTE